MVRDHVFLYQDLVADKRPRQKVNGIELTLMVLSRDYNYLLVDWSCVIQHTVYCLVEH